MCHEQGRAVHEDAGKRKTNIYKENVKITERFMEERKRTLRNMKVQKAI